MASSTDAIIGLTGTLTTVGVMSDVALRVSPKKRKSKKKKRMRLSL